MMKVSYLRDGGGGGGSGAGVGDWRNKNGVKEKQCPSRNWKQNDQVIS
ncbi:MAG: hypothetical protein AB1611_07620 [bacterium]